MSTMEREADGAREHIVEDEHAWLRRQAENTCGMCSMCRLSSRCWTTAFTAFGARRGRHVTLRDHIEGTP